jgi:hypothetical protein
MTGEFQSLAASLREKHLADERALAGAEAVKDAERERVRDARAKVLLSTVLPVLRRAKEEFEAEGIPSKIEQRVSGDDPYIIFQCKGSASGSPASKRLFLILGPSGRVEARLGKGYLTEAPGGGISIGDHSPDDPELPKWFERLLGRVLTSYFENPTGARVD